MCVYVGVWHIQHYAMTSHVWVLYPLICLLVVCYLFHIHKHAPCIYSYIHVCVYVYMFTRTHNTHTHTTTHTLSLSHTHTHARTHTHMHAHTHMHTHTQHNQQQGTALVKLVRLNAIMGSLETIGTIERTATAYIRRISKVFALLGESMENVYILGYSRGASGVLYLCTYMLMIYYITDYIRRIRKVFELLGESIKLKYTRLLAWRLR